MVANAPRPVDLLAGLLDRGYTQATRQVIAALVRDSQTGAVAERLKAFDARAAELAAAGEAMAADDPYLRALVAEFGTAMRRGALRIDAAAEDVQRVGIDAAGRFVRQTTLPGMSDAQLASVGMRWNQPDPEAIASVVQYTSSGAWDDELKAFGDLDGQVQAIALRGIVAGQGPLRTAADVRAAVEGFPVWRANNMMRTLQLTAYRDAAVVAQVANADILENEVIRIAALDARTCMACVALHGTTLKLGERVNDHRQGRCTSIAQVKGRPRTVQSGEEWFAGRTEAQQRAQMGPAAYEAWKAGAIDLQDFVQRGTDKVFGEVVTEASLRGMLGGAAQDYYTRGPKGGGGGGAAPVVLNPTGGSSRNALDYSQLPKPLKAIVDRVTGLIDRVHGTNQMDAIPVDKSNTKTKNGSYSHSTTGNAIDIKISTKGDHPETTFTHEFGHFLDHQRLGVKGQWASEQAANWSNHDPSKGGPLSAWYKAVTATSEYKFWSDVRSNKGSVQVEVNGQPSRLNIDLKYLRYIMQPKELWARSYAQYIAVKSGDATMLAQINKLANAPVRTQWSSTEFDAVVKAIDDAFIEEGLIDG